MSLSFSEFNSTNKVDLLKQQLSMEEDSNLANFNPPKNPIIQTKEDKPIDTDNQLKHEETINNIYYNQHLPNVNYNPNEDFPKQYNNNTNLETINKKLDYLIKLFEEQREFRTEGILEELILYIFFGIFIICVIHSFTKVKPYSR